jgi:hypothetical protein
MSKRLVTSLVLFSLQLCSNFLAQSVTNNQSQELAKITGEKVELTYQAVKIFYLIMVLLLHYLLADVLVEMLVF